MLGDLYRAPMHSQRGEFASGLRGRGLGSLPCLLLSGIHLWAELPPPQLEREGDSEGSLVTLVTLKLVNEMS